MANSVAGQIRKSTDNIGKGATAEKSSGMQWSLYDARGRRKYLVPSERYAVITRALRTEGKEGVFCATIAICGCRLSEALNLVSESIDDGDKTVTFETLKRRRRGIFRSVPVPQILLGNLNSELSYRARQLDPARARERLWKWSRTTGWRHVKRIMLEAGIPKYLAHPKALRHAFAIDSSEKKITPGLIQNLMGHTKLETTMIYATPRGDEARSLVRSLWLGFEGE